MLDKLEDINKRFIEVSKLIVDPEIISDMKQYIQLNKEYKDLEPIIEVYKTYKNILSNIESSKEMLKDDEMKDMAKQEIEDLSNECNNSSGDINNDGILNIIDVVTIVSFVTTSNEDSDLLCGADFNSDGIINIIDIVSIVNEIIN